MFQILIVEDEKIERETLADIIKANIPQCDQVLSARNGLEGLEQFSSNHPQLVCADINLPGLNGLDMIRIMKERNPACQYLILSSYNYFEYAQEAIRLGVNDFILKPYNIAEFIQVLTTIVQRMQGNDTYEEQLQQKLSRLQPMLERECLYGIVSDENEIELRRRVHLLNGALNSGFCMVIREESLEISPIKKVCESFLANGYGLYEKLHGSLVCFLMYEKPPTKTELENFCTQINQLEFDPTALGIGPLVNDIADFYHSFLAAREHVGKLLDLYEQLMATHQNQNLLQDLIEAGEQLMISFEKNAEEEFKKILHRYIDELMNHEYSEIIASLTKFYEGLFQKIHLDYPNMDPKQVILLPLIYSSTILQDLPLNIKLNLKKIFKLIEEERFSNTNYLVKEAIHYIDHNYQRPIVLNDVAEHLKVSPFHISRLLSSSMHISFTELVAKKRVEASKAYLKSDERIKAIATLVGFQGQSYYNKIFKKYTGMTPKEYRNKIKK